MVLQTHVLPTFIPVTGLRNPPLWFRGSVIDPSSRDGPGLRHLLSLSRPPNPPPLLSECFIWALLNLQHQTVSAHFLLPSTRKCRFYNSQSPPHMNGGVENSRKWQKVWIVLFDWKQLVGLHYCDVLRRDEGMADLRLQLGLILLHGPFADILRDDL